MISTEMSATSFLRAEHVVEDTTEARFDGPMLAKNRPRKTPVPWQSVPGYLIKQRIVIIEVIPVNLAISHSAVTVVASASTILIVQTP